MLVCQRHLFPLSPDEAYLNGASRSPQLRAGAQAMRAALAWREENNGMPIEAFFGPVQKLRATFARLVGSHEAERVALIPSASYGIATVAKNLPLRRGQHVIVVQDQFPSNFYAWEGRCADAGASMRTVARPAPGSEWSTAVLENIDERTAAVAIAPLHWSDGTIFDLRAIRQRTEEVGAWLVVDGTQAIGAYPFDVEVIRPDALIAGGYKWLLGPYGCGYAWYGPRMDNGKPLEENWVNRAGSDDFSQLANYQRAYRPLAGRYSVGEHSNFLTLPMQQAGLEQVLEWTPEEVQIYTANLWAKQLIPLRALGIELADKRAHHLVGLRLPGLDIDRLKRALIDRRVSVSYRGDAVRVSPSVYNTEEHMGKLVEGIREAVG